MIRRIVAVAAALAALAAPTVVSVATAAPAHAFVQPTWRNVSDHGYRIGMVAHSNTLGSDFLLAAGQNAIAIGFYNPGGGVCTRVYWYNGSSWQYTGTVTSGGRWYAGLDVPYSLDRLYCG